MIRFLPLALSSVLLFGGELTDQELATNSPHVEDSLALASGDVPFERVTLEMDELPYEGMDIFNPTDDDYRKIQDYLSYGERPYLDWVSDALWKLDCMTENRKLRVREIVLFSEEEEIRKGVIHCGEPDAEKDQCIITYASFNKYAFSFYPKFQELLIKSICQSSFKGDILWQVGGWPDIEGGSLKLAHVPYAFKVSMFREAKRLGYKRVFWIDCSYVVIKDLDPIFEHIAKKGFFAPYSPFNSSYPPSQSMNACQLGYFSISEAELSKLPSYWAGAIGLDVTSVDGSRILDKWYKTAEDMEGFLNPLPEQNAFGNIMYKLGLESFDTKMCDYFNDWRKQPEPYHYLTGARFGMDACIEKYREDIEAIQRSKSNTNN